MDDSDIRSKYLEPYHIDREVSAASRSGQIRYNNQVVPCKACINHYPHVRAKLIKLQQQEYPIEGMLRELDQYLTAFPGSLPMPDFMRGSRDDADDVECIARDPIPSDIIHTEKYILQCLLERVVKGENINSVPLVKQEDTSG